MSRTALTASVLLVVGACAHLQRSRAQRSDICSLAASDVPQPFDSANMATLAGRFHLTLISDREDEAGHVAAGTLILQPNDSSHRVSDRVLTEPWGRVGDRVLWGWATLDRRDAMIPWTADPASRSPEQPGVLLHPNGILELGVWRGVDGSSTALRVRSVSRRGFAGTWGSDLGIMVLMDHGRRVPNPHGHFCAIRER